MNRDAKIAILQTILNKIKFDDSRFKVLIKDRPGNTEKTNGASDFSKETIRRLRIQNKKLLEQVAFQKSQVKKSNSDKDEIMGQLNKLSRLNDSLALALGTCSLCWGEDPECKHCEGNGSSGWKNVNMRFFKLYVWPTLDQVDEYIKKLKNL